MGEYRKEKHFDLFRHYKSKHSTTSTEDRKIFRFVSARRPGVERTNRNILRYSVPGE